MWHSLKSGPGTWDPETWDRGLWDPDTQEPEEHSLKSGHETRDVGP